VESYSYDVYGQPAITDEFGNGITVSDIGNSHMFTGRRWDNESGLYFFRARHYSPVLGRFMQMDPVGPFSLETNLYAYAQNRPSDLTDPLGLGFWQDLAAFAAGAGAATFVVVTGGTGALVLVGALGAGAAAGGVTYTVWEKTKANPECGWFWIFVKGAGRGLAGASIPVAWAATLAPAAAATGATTSHAASSAIAAYNAGNRLLAEHLARLAGYSSLHHLLKFREQLRQALTK
jgi:RHS repeat-associated protein